MKIKNLIIPGIIIILILVAGLIYLIQSNSFCLEYNHKSIAELLDECNDVNGSFSRYNIVYSDSSREGLYVRCKIFVPCDSIEIYNDTGFFTCIDMVFDYKCTAIVMGVKS